MLVGSNLEKCGKFRKNVRFSGQLWPDWGNTAWADRAGLGSIWLISRYDQIVVTHNHNYIWFNQSTSR